MAKIILSLVLVVAVAAVLCQAEPAQRAQQRRPVRYTRPRTRFLARQEEAPVAADEAPDAVTPYPSADELKPEVPFDEAEVPAADAAAEPIPDEVYGPPESDQSYNQPDEIYGPPEVNENDLPAEDGAASAAETFPAPLDEQQARLVAARRGNLRRKAAYRQSPAQRSARPAKLRKAVPVRRSA